MAEPIKVPEILTVTVKRRQNDTLPNYHNDAVMLDKYLFTSKGKSWKQIEKLCKFGK